MAYTYDADSRVSGMTWTLGGNQIGDLEYAYDPDGRVVEKSGSMAATSLPQAVTGNAFNADNEMTSFNGTALSHDANGNLTNDGTNSYTWDARSRLTQINRKHTTVASFVYDPFGRRMAKTVSGLTTDYLYDGLNPIEELQGGTASAKLLTGLGIDEYFTRSDSSGTMAFLADALGSTIGLVNSAGSIATSYTYQPFGATTASGTPNANPYQFTGRENDATGLYFNRARYYDAGFQRFVSQDPLDFEAGDTNLYSYVFNQPTDLTDPSGTQDVVPYEPPPGFDLDPFGPQLPGPSCSGPPQPWDPDKTPRRHRCEYIGEVSGTCMYNCKGYGGIATFPKPPGMQHCPPSFDGFFPGET